MAEMNCFRYQQRPVCGRNLDSGHLVHLLIDHQRHSTGCITRTGCSYRFYESMIQLFGIVLHEISRTSESPKSKDYVDGHKVR